MEEQHIRVLREEIPDGDMLDKFLSQAIGVLENPPEQGTGLAKLWGVYSYLQLLEELSDVQEGALRLCIRQLLATSSDWPLEIEDSLDDEAA